MASKKEEGSEEGRRRRRRRMEMIVVQIWRQFSLLFQDQRACGFDVRVIIMCCLACRLLFLRETEEKQEKKAKVFLFFCKNFGGGPHFLFQFFFLEFSARFLLFRPTIKNVGFSLFFCFCFCAFWAHFRFWAFCFCLTLRGEKHLDKTKED